MPIRIDVENGRIEADSGNSLTQLDELDAFARRDGFNDWREMMVFWQENHRSVDVFSGVMIRWDPLRPVATDA